MTLNSESVFIYPTDTVWGIGASIESKKGRERIAEIKKVSLDKPLSIMFTDIEWLFNSFNFPASMSADWLRSYFKLESTLGIPLKLSKIDIPSWVTGASSLVSVRCLETPELKNISDMLKAPFFSTSLNLTGEPPIINFQDALNFKFKYAVDSEIFGNSSHNLSGRSSTIVFYRDESFHIVREGLRVEEIKEHLKSTGLRIS